MKRTELALIAEDVATITSGARTFAEQVTYRYAEVEKRHRLRFLFDPLNNLGDTRLISD